MLTNVRYYYHKLKVKIMHTPELIDPAAVEKIVQQAVNSLPTNSVLTEVVNEFGIDLAAALRPALATIDHARHDEWLMCRQLPSEQILAAGNNADPMMAMPYTRPPVPKTIDELVTIARRAGADRGRRQQNATPVTDLYDRFWDDAKRRARLYDPHKAHWFLQRLGAIVNGAADELGDVPPVPDAGAGIQGNVGTKAAQQLRRGGATRCRQCGFGHATIETGCPNCGAPVVRPQVVMVPAKTEPVATGGSGRADAPAGSPMEKFWGRTAHTVFE